MATITTSAVTPESGITCVNPNGEIVDGDATFLEKALRILGSLRDEFDASANSSSGIDSTIYTAEAVAIERAITRLTLAF